MRKLSKPESQSSLWLKLSDHLANRRDAARCKNDNDSLGSTETSFVRGKIAAYKEIIALGNQDEIINP